MRKAIAGKWIAAALVLAGAMTGNVRGEPLSETKNVTAKTQRGAATGGERALPNVVFILVDDLGYSDVGAYGSDYYETPNIDELAREGMKFTTAYSAYMLCSPTRAALLTGKNPARLHITHAIPIEGDKRLDNTMLLGPDYVKNLPLEEVTVAESLKEAGYNTVSIGKWHVAWDEQYYPEHQGFDVNIGGGWMGNPGSYFCPYQGAWRMTPSSPLREWKVLPSCESGEYLTDRLTEEAIQFIEKHNQEPFFVYLQHYAVHTPLQAKASLIDKYKKKPVNSFKGHTNAAYAAMIESVDQSVGRIINKVDELGLTDNTIVIFTSDNGGNGRITSNWPFRGNKGNFHEGGIRVPLIIKWPGAIEAGTVCDTPVISMDLYPTILGLVGLPLRPKQHLDGINLVPLLTKGADITRKALYWHFPGYIAVHPDPATPCSVIRYESWKLIEHFGEGTVELYNLKNDPKESNNLARRLPQKVNELKSKLEAWRTSTKVQMPQPNPDYKPEVSVKQR